MNVLEVSIASLNLFSFMIGMFFAATMFRAKALIFVVIYAFALAAYYWGKAQV
jgi:hypothetical protein